VEGSVPPCGLSHTYPLVRQSSGQGNVHSALDWQQAPTTDAVANLNNAFMHQAWPGLEQVGFESRKHSCPPPPPRPPGPTCRGGPVNQGYHTWT
jgi:hypothetical protein